MIREIIVIVSGLLLLTGIVIAIILEYKKENMEKNSNWGYYITTNKKGESESISTSAYIDNCETISVITYLVALAGLIIGMIAIVIPVSYKHEYYTNRYEIEAFADSHENTMYGEINGGFLYMDGEITMDTATYLTFIVEKENGKVEVLKYNLLDENVNLYLTDDDKAYMLEVSKITYKHCELFGKEYNKSEEVTKERSSIYIPRDAIVYNDILDGE